MTNRRV